jgi:hypothetical protein
MPEAVADPLSSSCYLLLSGAGIEESQRLGADPMLARPRDAHGRFAKGSSGKPRGRPRGIPNPKRRVPDLVARPLRHCRICSTASRICCGLSPSKCCRCRSPPSTRRSISGSTSHRCARSRTSGRCCPPCWRPLRSARSHPAEAVRIARRGCGRLRAVRRLARLAPVRA